ncbi:unnamed protein product [Cyprideis torosa]|uniref:Uncharacterized protein n=1 Tax=Cyprideis torosa TaxID=163714 RepID=A0A7R8WAW1_9CRUS|nr:unnamed protein product [Cyprideis torosa]CAG0891485.1 unnamed protein product [Cyprideis torosa]
MEPQEPVPVQENGLKSKAKCFCHWGKPEKREQDLSEQFMKPVGAKMLVLKTPFSANARATVVVDTRRTDKTIVRPGDRVLQGIASQPSLVIPMDLSPIAPAMGGSRPIPSSTGDEDNDTLTPSSGSDISNSVASGSVSPAVSLEASQDSSIIDVIIPNQIHLGLYLTGNKDIENLKIFICGLNPSGYAFRSGQFQIGDEILGINDVSFKGRSHLNVPVFLRSIRDPELHFRLRRSKELQTKSMAVVMKAPPKCLPATLALATPEDIAASVTIRKVTLFKQEAKSIGIQISDFTPQVQENPNEPPDNDLSLRLIQISGILKNSIAESGGLTTGDIILSVNQIPFIGISYRKAFSLLKSTQGEIVIEICSATDLQQAILKRHIEPPNRAASPVPNGDAAAREGSNSPGNSGDDQLNIHAKRRASAIDGGIAAPEVGGQSLIPPQGTKVDLEIDSIPPDDLNGLGISVVPTSNGDVKVLEILPGGLIHKDGRIEVGDVLLEIRGKQVDGMNYHRIQEEIMITNHLGRKNNKITLSFVKEKCFFIEYEIHVNIKGKTPLGLCLYYREHDHACLHVSDVASNAALTLGDIRPGDILYKINGQVVHDPIASLLELKATRGSMTLSFRRLN